MQITIPITGDFYKYSWRIVEALEAGNKVGLIDQHAVHYGLPSDMSFFSDPRILFEIFEGVFERFDVWHVMTHMYMLPFDKPTFDFCLAYWKRTRRMVKWSQRTDEHTYL